MSARGEAGFTLVEALASLFVFSLIASGCVALLMQSVSSQRIAGEAHMALRELQTARSLFAGDLMQTAQRRIRNPEGGHQAAFVGSAAEGVAFVRAAAEPDPRSGAIVTLSYVRYVIEGDRVLRRSRTALDAPNAPDSERVIFAQAQDARFEFFDGTRWLPEWRAAGATGPPRAVALAATLPRYGAVRIEALTSAAP